MKRDKLRIGVITAALAMMIAGGVLTWQQDARNGKADQTKQGETAQLTEDESTGTTEQRRIRTEKQDQEKQRRMKKRVQHPELWILQKIRKRQLRQQGLHRI